MSDKQDNKFDIPVSNPMSPVKVHVRLKYPDPNPIDGKYGTSYMYGVQIMETGEDKVIFATEAFHRVIQETGATEGTVVALARFGTGTNTKWGAEYVDGPQDFSKDKPSADAQDAPGTQGGPDMQGHQPTGSARAYADTQDGPDVVGPPGHTSDKSKQASAYANRREYTYEDISSGDYKPVNIYEPLTNYEVVRQILEDNAVAYFMAHDVVMENVPRDENGDPAWEEERIGAVATTLFLALSKSVNQLIQGRFGVILSDLNRVKLANDAYQEEPQQEQTADHKFKQWYKELTQPEKNAYSATTEDEFLSAVMAATPRYGNNQFGSRGAVNKFTDEIPLDANREDGLVRVLLLRRAKAYASLRDAGVDGDMARDGALKMVPALDDLELAGYID